MMRIIHALQRDRGGNVLMLTGLAVLFLFAMAGAGVDFGRQQLVRMKLQNASDAAAIAAASMPESTSEAQRRAVALRYYNLNYPTSYLGVARPTPTISVTDPITVQATSSFNTNFLAGLGLPQMESQSLARVNRAQSASSVYDVILVMDNSGSMGFGTTAPNFAVLNQSQTTATRNLFELICRAQETNYLNYFCTFRRQNVPNGTGGTRSYNSTPNCRAQAPTNYCRAITSGFRRAGAAQDGSDILGFGLNVNSRLNALRFVAGNFITRIIDEGDPGSRIAIVRWADRVLQSRDLTNNTTLLRADIANMAANGATNPVRAMQQAVTYAQGFAPDHIKAVVFMTDGKPTLTGDVNYANESGPFIDTDSCNGIDFCTPAVTQTNALCTQLKNAGVQLYTVGFLDPNDAEFTAAPGDYNRAVSFLRDCASVDGEGNPRAFTAQNGAELEQAFTQILSSLGKIRIAQ